MRRGAYIILPIVFFLAFAASDVHADSVVWTKVQPNLLTTGENGPRRSWTSYLYAPGVSITYAASVWEVDANDSKMRQLTNNEQIPKGTRVLFEFKPHVYTDISWYGTGNIHGTPYGDWVAGAALSGPGTGSNSVICVGKNLYESVGEAKQKGVKLYAELSVAPPTKHVAVNGSGVSCAASGSTNDQICTLNEPGSINAQFTFDPTSGHFYGGYISNHTYVHATCDYLGIPMETYTGSNFDQNVLASSRSQFTMNVPIQTIPFTINVDMPSATATPPFAPALAASSGAACTVDQPHSISMTATDPNGDNIRYGIDWDADGSIDQYVPASGYVPSGSTETAVRTYSIAGSKTVKVRTQDEGGLSSNWATLSFNCADSATVGLNNNGNNTNTGGNTGGNALTTVIDIRVIPSLVKSGNTTKVNWSATAVSSCSVTAPNGDSWNGLQSVIGGEISTPITAETTYTLSCLDLDNATQTKTATVKVIPVFREK